MNWKDKENGFEAHAGYVLAVVQGMHDHLQGRFPCSYIHAIDTRDHIINTAQLSEAHHTCYDYLPRRYYSIRRSLMCSLAEPLGLGATANLLKRAAELFVCATNLKIPLRQHWVPNTDSTYDSIHAWRCPNSCIHTACGGNWVYNAISVPLKTVRTGACLASKRMFFGSLACTIG